MPPKPRILAAAKKLLVRGGARELTMRAIAGEAKMSLGNLQYHFASLDLLLEALLDDVLVTSAAEVQETGLDALFAQHEDTKIVRLFYEIWALAAAKPKLRKPLKAFYAQFIAAMGGGVEGTLAVAFLEGLSLFRSGVCGEKTAELDAAAKHFLARLTVPRPTRVSL